MIRIGLAASLMAFAAGPALAFPEGAPWTAADPDGAESCGSCHYDGEAVIDSRAITLGGLPRRFVPGRTYRMTLRFDPKAPGAVAAGFLVVADAGCFAAVGPDLEATCEGVRSTAPVRLAPGATWSFDWTAPAGEEAQRDVRFLVAANGVNDDASPFGDAPHYRAWRIKKR